MRSEAYVVKSTETSRGLYMEERKKISIAARLKTKFSSWAQASTSHGIPNIFRSDILLVKVMWAICVLAALGLCSYLVVDSIIKFLQFETTSKIQVKIDQYNFMPALTICSTNFFANQGTSRQIILDYFSQVTNRTINHRPELKNIYNFSIPDQIEKFKFDLSRLKQLMYAGDNYSDETRASIGYNESMVFLECLFGDEKCDKDAIVRYFDINYGNCFRLNTGIDNGNHSRRLFTQEEPGYLNGISLKVFVGVFEKQVSNVFNDLPTYGILVSIDNQSSIPITTDHVVYAYTGTCTFIGLKKTVSIDIPGPYSNCQDVTVQGMLDNIKYGAEFKARNLTYSQNVCFAFCKQYYIVRNCSCYSAALPSKIGAPLCKSEREVNCTTLALTSFNAKTECYDDCPAECELVKYDVFMSQNQYPNPGLEYERLKENPYLVEQFALANISKEDITYDRISDAVSCVNVFFENVEFTLIEQTPSKSFVDLISDIGGQLGLFTGISLLSFFELAELVFELLWAFKY